MDTALCGIVPHKAESQNRFFYLERLFELFSSFKKTKHQIYFKITILLVSENSFVRRA